MLNSLLLDVLAVCWFLSAWIGYTAYSRRKARSTPCLYTAVDKYARRWMEQITRREVRIADATLLATVERNITFFATSTILILGGLLTILGSQEKAMGVLAGIPFAISPSPGMWELKLTLLIVAFVYAFFTFTWAMRQLNFVTMMVGGNPMPQEPEEERLRFANSTAQVLVLGSSAFNYGLRTYYFCLGALAWFIHPLLFMAATVWVVLVLYRREFKSDALLAMLHRLD
jgi:uncharacterized membrane protein